MGSDPVGVRLGWGQTCTRNTPSSQAKLQNHLMPQPNARRNAVRLLVSDERVVCNHRTIVRRVVEANTERLIAIGLRDVCQPLMTWNCALNAGVACQVALSPAS